jgi:hypothetical protein
MNNWMPGKGSARLATFVLSIEIRDLLLYHATCTYYHKTCSTVQYIHFAPVLGKFT